MDNPRTSVKPTVPYSIARALESGSLGPMLQLLHSLAVPYPVSCGIVEDCPYGETLLHYAAWFGKEDAVVALLRNGARVNAVGLHSGCTPLHSAAAGGHLGITALLVGLGADTHATTSAGWTALHSCCSRGHEQVAWFLEQRGLRMDAALQDGRTAQDLLDQALSQQRKTKAFLSAGAALPKLCAADLLENGSLHIQIASDTHVEFYQSFDEIPDDMIRPSAPILALLGDIGNPALPTYREFLYRQAERFKLVLVLAGNHEFYSPRSAPPHPTIGDLNAAIHAICAAAPGKNIAYMDKGLIELPGYSILGCILWSSIPEHKRAQAAQQMNDYRLIFKSNSHNFSQADVFTPDDSNEWHEREVAWLQEQIRQSMAKGNTAVVLTHHTPSYQVSGSGLAFSSSLEYMFKDKGSNVAVWAHGHTHYNDDRIIQGTRVVSNMVGYKHEMNSSYHPDLVIRV